MPSRTGAPSARSVARAIERHTAACFALGDLAGTDRGATPLRTAGVQIDDALALARIARAIPPAYRYPGVPWDVYVTIAKRVKATRARLFAYLDEHPECRDARSVRAAAYQADLVYRKEVMARHRALWDAARAS